LDENIIFTTAEIVVAELHGFSFEREVDKETGYLELLIRNDFKNK
jgi:predicted DNA-binding protein with PD1-like motif